MLQNKYIFWLTQVITILEALIDGIRSSHYTTMTNKKIIANLLCEYV